MGKIKFIKTVVAVILSMLILGSTVSANTNFNTDEIPYNSYTYWDDLTQNEKTAVYCKPMYEVESVIDAKSIGIESFEVLSDVFVDKNGDIYLIDSKGSRVVQLDKNYQLVSEFSSIHSAEGEITFKDSTGIFVDDEGLIYICGTESEKLWITDNMGNLVDELLLPDSDVIPDTFKYRPIRVAKDNKGYIYILSDGSYFGTILYSPKREFLGFYGANSVKLDVFGVLKSLWNRFTMNDTKKSATIKELPYQFTDMAIDDLGFVYTATGSTGEDSQTGQIKRLNPAGNNILDSDSVNFADVGQTTFSQDMSGIDIDGNGYIYTFDATYGRIYVYDSECKLLCAFGGGLSTGVQDGSFKNLVAISVYNDKIFACDKGTGRITVFSETEYGSLVKQTRLLTINSKYPESIAGWESVLSQDRNSQLAYEGLAKAAIYEKDYDTALEYAKLGANRELYSTAYQYVRLDYLSEHFTLLFILVVVLGGGLIVFSIYKKKKQLVLIKNQDVRMLFSAWSSPFKAFGEIKEKKKGSIVIAGTVAVLLYLSEVFKTVFSGFIFSYYNPATYNVLYTLVSTIGLIVLWVVVNWAVCTLLGGIGKIKEIAIVTCYSVLPIVFANIIYTILSNFLLSNESQLLSLITIVAYAYALFMLIVGTIVVHDFGFGRFVGTTVLTILGMMLVVFLIFLVALLVQQFGAFLLSVALEIIY